MRRRCLKPHNMELPHIWRCLKMSNECFHSYIEATTIVTLLHHIHIKLASAPHTITFHKNSRFEIHTYTMLLLLHLCMREISPFSTLPMNQKEDVFLVFMIIRVRVRDLCCVFLFKGTNDITSILEWHISHCYDMFLRWK